MNVRSRKLLEAIAETITAKLVMMSRTGVFSAYSEYLIYEPVVLVAKHLGWEVRCEHKLPKQIAGRGDHKRIDFLFYKEDKKLAVAMEIKWPRKRCAKIPIAKDIEKLRGLNDPRYAPFDALVILIAGFHSYRAGKCKLIPRLNPHITAKPIVRALWGERSGRGVSIYAIKDDVL